MSGFIEARELSCVYHGGTENEFTALDRVSFSIEEGEFVAIVGTNGSGKSTLAKHFNALLVPTGGKCFACGMDTAQAENVWQIRQQVGMVFQNPDNQLVATVVEEDVAFGPENLGLSSKEIARRVKESLELVGMSEFSLRSPHQLSGGQKQRVAIAGALAMQTKCLVLDEPTAMLDPKGRQEVLKTVERLHKERKMTIVYITHYMEEAASADRIIVLKDGRIAASGAPAEIFSQVEKMRALGLAVPAAAEAAFELRKLGFDIPKGIITNEELAVAVCR
jgi:energy-coupling factor transport system ATP-binding protein